MEDELTIYRGCRADIPLEFLEPNNDDGTSGGPTILTGLGPFVSEVKANPSGKVLLTFDVTETDLANGLLNLEADVPADIRICEAYFYIKDTTGYVTQPPTRIFIKDL
jgi:hypothetical protein